MHRKLALSVLIFVAGIVSSQQQEHLCSPHASPLMSNSFTHGDLRSLLSCLFHVQDLAFCHIYYGRACLAIGDIACAVKELGTAIGELESANVSPFEENGAILHAWRAAVMYEGIAQSYRPDRSLYMKAMLLVVTSQLENSSSELDPYSSMAIAVLLRECAIGLEWQYWDLLEALIIPAALYMSDPTHDQEMIELGLQVPPQWVAFFPLNPPSVRLALASSICNGYMKMIPEVYGDVAMSFDMVHLAHGVFDGSISTQTMHFDGDLWLHSTTRSAEQNHLPEGSAALFFDGNVNQKNNRHLQKPRLRIGYLFSVIADDNIGVTYHQVFKHHDPIQVEVYVFAIYIEHNSMFAERIRSSPAVSALIELSTNLIPRQYDSAQAALIISSFHLHVMLLADLQMNGAENAFIYAFRPLTIQVALYGFPGALGQPWSTHLATDRVASPPEFVGVTRTKRELSSAAAAFSEKLLLWPKGLSAYLINSMLNAEEPTLATRAELGLREDAFVLSAFHQYYKLSPMLLHVWCNILLRVPRSALWAYNWTEVPNAADRLGTLLASCGVNYNVQLVLAGSRKNIERLRLADIFLDSPAYNAHSTLVDVLWSDVPAVTLAMEHEAGRIAASAIEALGQPKPLYKDWSSTFKNISVNDCSTSDQGCYGNQASHAAVSWKEYEDKVIEISRRPQHKDKSVCHRNVPLFATGRWVSALENVMSMTADMEMHLGAAAMGHVIAHEILLPHMPCPDVSLR
mmetsp:Transcript_16346/g.26805  ORF Transcript_16346/g.26805 Transcript_16346/m.26805 type:complete len:743 (-) Transcript_16346:555-2783(-)